MAPVSVKSNLFVTVRKYSVNKRFLCKNKSNKDRYESLVCY